MTRACCFSEWSTTHRFRRSQDEVDQARIRGRRAGDGSRRVRRQCLNQVDSAVWRGRVTNPAPLVSSHASDCPWLGGGGGTPPVELWLQQLSRRAAHRN